MDTLAITLSLLYGYFMSKSILRFCIYRRHADLWSQFGDFLDSTEECASFLPSFVMRPIHYAFDNFVYNSKNAPPITVWLSAKMRFYRKFPGASWLMKDPTPKFPEPAVLQSACYNFWELLHEHPMAVTFANLLLFGLVIPLILEETAILVYYLKCRRYNLNLRGFKSTYLLKKTVGEGVFAMVYAGLKRKINGESRDSDILAFKFIDRAVLYSNYDPKTKAGRKAIKMASVSELKATRACSGSRYVAEVVEVYSTAPYIILVMPCFMAGCLHSQMFLHRPNGFPELEIINFARQIILGLQWIHGKGIIHNDIKPGNLLINEKGVIKISDFGNALCGFPKGVFKKVPAMGTSGYMAPEALFENPVNNIVDYWSLGATLYNLHAPGSIPFIIPRGWPKVNPIVRLAYQYVVVTNRFHRKKTYSSRYYNFLKGLFIWDPTKRLGSMKSPLGEILEHKIFIHVKNGMRYKPSKLPIYSNIHDIKLEQKIQVRTTDKALLTPHPVLTVLQRVVRRFINNLRNILKYAKPQKQQKLCNNF